ncbi:MAG: hypothetical protein ACYDC6_13950 [Acidobacteriaceae bacterium]
MATCKLLRKGETIGKPFVKLGVQESGERRGLSFAVWRNTRNAAGGQPNGTRADLQ